MSFLSHLRHSQSNFLLVLAFYSLVFACIMPDVQTGLSEYIALFSLQTHLLQDFFALAGLSATYMNVALHYVVAFCLLHSTRSQKLTGLQFSALGIFIGHSFFGTHILNILPILCGVFLYSKWAKQPYRRFKTMSLFATATAPLVSFIWTQPTLPLTLALPLGTIIGLFIGFISAPLAEHFLKFHQGFSLYNYGFTTGIIAMFMILLFPYFHISIPRVVVLNHYDTHYHFWYLIGTMIIGLVGARLNMHDTLAKFPKLLKHSGRVPDDFVSSFGTRIAALNMTINGLVYTLILSFLNVPFTGPTIGGIFTIIGFSAFGKHIVNCLPVSFGVLIAALLSHQPLSDIQVILPFLFGTALAPISGYYGVIAGISAGFLQFHLTGVVLPLHQGMTLYNNGFSAGFIAAFMVPIIETIDERFKKIN